MYQALYRKYRPQTFDDVIGQDSITQVLKSQVISDKLSHAYLFTGSRGTGKTTCAKILAKAVNCLHPVDGNPCNCCPACKSIDDGSCMDVLEIDAASNNGVDNVRDLRDDAVYSPAEVKKRVYIVDEVHMLSMSAFNALLKIIEEPPPHLMFILATTELHKVPATILSRCQRFSFRRITPEDVAARINYVAYEEGIDLEPEAASLLGRLADGAMRDGLSLLDQCAAAAQGTLSVETVYGCLGIAGAKKAAELLQAAANRDAKTALTIFAEQYALGKDISAMIDELVCLCRDLLVLKTAPGAAGAMLSGICSAEQMKQMLPSFSAGELVRLTKLLQDTAFGFQKSANRRIDAELCLIRMCDPALDLDAVSLNARLTKLEEAAASGAFALPAEQKTAPVPEEEPKPAAPKKEAEKPASAPEPAPSETLPVGFWTDLVMAVKPLLSGSVGGYFSTGERSMLTPSLLGDQLLIETASDFVTNAVNDDETRQILSQKASGLLHRPVNVRFRTKEKHPGGQNDPMQELIRRGKAYPDIFHIEEES